MYNIKDFQSFLDNISEAFDSFEEITFKTKNNDLWDGVFNVSGEEWNLIIRKIIDNNINSTDEIYTIKFNVLKNNISVYSVDKKDKIYDMKKTIKVLSTIKKYTVEFMESVNPKILFFYCSDNDKSREQIYLNFSNDLIKNSSYDLFHYQNFDRPLFIIYTPMANLKKLENIILKAIDYLNSTTIN